MIFISGLFDVPIPILDLELVIYLERFCDRVRSVIICIIQLVR